MPCPAWPRPSVLHFSAGTEPRWAVLSTLSARVACGFSPLPGVTRVSTPWCITHGLRGHRTGSVGNKNEGDSTMGNAGKPWPFWPGMWERGPKAKGSPAGCAYTVN